MREEIYFGDVHGYRYPSTGAPTYSLVIAHGIGGHGGTYDVFCEPLASRGVEVVSIDLPGHGLARNTRGNWRFDQWLEDVDTAAKAMRERFGKPVFVLGSSQGSAVAFHSLAFSSSVSGAVTMCIILSEVEPAAGDHLHRRFAQFRSAEAREIAAAEGDHRRIDLVSALDWNKNYSANDPDILSKKMADPMRAWSYGFASMASYYNYAPPMPASGNVKPILVTVGAHDPLVSTDYVKRCFAVIGGPKTLAIVPDGTHQLMLYHTEQYVPLVDNWIRETILKTC